MILKEQLDDVKAKALLSAAPVASATVIAASFPRSDRALSVG
jgi:hypothetical protein